MPSVRKFDVCVGRQKSDNPRDGVWWTKIGRASENEKGQIALFIEVLPINYAKNDVLQAMCFEQRERDDLPSSGGSRAAAAKDDDEIPF